MGWQIGYDDKWQRDIGYGVPAPCDFPDCAEEIDRGLEYVCGSEPYGGEYGCGLFFCGEHKTGHLDIGDRCYGVCDRCEQAHETEQPVERYTPKPDLQEWLDWKATDESWAPWRAEQAAKETSNA